jgi:phosphopantothenoylcysteine synthetase/decarboxylase
MHDAGTQGTPRGTLYLVVSGAMAPEGLPSLVVACQAAGWRVTIFSTPDGLRFTDTDELARLTGAPVRSEFRMPGTGSPVPPADAVLACPLTFNSVNKLAHGQADNFAIGLLCEMIGYGVPVTVVPHCKPQLASHPAFTASLATLRQMGVRLVFHPDAPYDRRLPSWSEVVAALPVPACRGLHLWTPRRLDSGSRGQGDAVACPRPYSPD